MPEGPEITLMIDNLKFIKNKNLKDIVLTSRSRYTPSEIKNFRDLKKNLPLKIKKIYNIGKEIFIHLSNDYFLILNMGMSGNLSTYKDEYTVIEFKLNKKKSFYMNDPRKFGTFEIKRNINDDIKKLGYDPINTKLSFDKFYENYIQKYKSRQYLYMKLLDQRIFAGMGNYLRAEVIYHSRVDPFCTYDKVSKNMWKRIYNSYKLLSIKSYISQSKLYGFSFQAYKRTDKDGLKRIINNKRSFWFFPKRIKYKC
jgi:formamidopyrimidine-DNA glycosylase